MAAGPPTRGQAPAALLHPVPVWRSPPLACARRGIQPCHPPHLAGASSSLMGSLKGRRSRSVWMGRAACRTTRSVQWSQSSTHTAAPSPPPPAFPRLSALLLCCVLCRRASAQRRNRARGADRRRSTVHEVRRRGHGWRPPVLLARCAESEDARQEVNSQGSRRRPAPALPARRGRRPPAQRRPRAARSARRTPATGCARARRQRWRCRAKAECGPSPQLGPEPGGRVTLHLPKLEGLQFPRPGFPNRRKTTHTPASLTRAATCGLSRRLRSNVLCAANATTAQRGGAPSPILEQAPARPTCRGTRKGSAHRTWRLGGDARGGHQLQQQRRHGGRPHHARRRQAGQRAQQQARAVVLRRRRRGQRGGQLG